MSTAQATKLYRGVTLEDRRAQRREALIRAAILVYGERGYRRATVRAVCEAAGITERYFYESFRNSEALLVASYEAVNAHLGARLQRAAADCAGGPPERAAAMLHAYYGALRESPDAARVFLVEIAGVSPAVDAVMTSTLERFGRLLADTIDPGGAAAGDDAGAALLRAGVVGGVVHIALAWIADGYAAPVAQVAAQATRLCAVLAPSSLAPDGARR